MEDDMIAMMARSWIFKYVADALLDKAFGGSVEMATVTCAELAGVEYSEVAAAITAAAAPFDTTVAKAAKRLLQCECGHETLGCGKSKLTLTENAGELCRKKVVFKNQNHRSAYVAAYNLFANLNAKVESINDANITGQETLQKWLKTTFQAHSSLTEDLMASAALLIPVARRQVETLLSSTTERPVEVPNCILGRNISFCGGNAQILSADPDKKVLADVLSDEKIPLDPAWGFTFLVQGKFDRVSFFP